MSTDDNKLSPKGIAAVTAINEAFWDQAIENVERRMAEEDRQRASRRIMRIKLTRPVHAQERSESRCNATSG